MAILNNLSNSLKSATSSSSSIGNSISNAISKSSSSGGGNIHTLPHRVQIGPDGNIISGGGGEIHTLPDRVQIGPDGNIISGGGGEIHTLPHIIQKEPDGNILSGIAKGDTTLPHIIKEGPEGDILSNIAAGDTTLPDRIQIGPDGEIIRGGESKEIEYSSIQNAIQNKDTGTIKSAVEQAQIDQLKKDATDLLKGNGNGLTNDEIKNQLLNNEKINSLTDAEVKEKMKELYAKEGLSEQEIKNKLKENEKLTSSELKEQFKEQYNKASVNGLINSSNASFITGGAAGLATGGERMSITISEIPNIVSKLRSCESRVREIWNDLLNTYINQIENSWAGADAQAYIEKVRSYNTKIENSAQALSLLADTYEKVITTSQDTQQKVMNVVNNY